MRIHRVAAASLTAFVISSALLGCAPEAVQPVAKDSSAVPAPAEVAEPAPEEKEVPPAAPRPTVLPATCEEILPAGDLAAIHDLLRPAEDGDAEFRLEGMLGPKGWSALSGGDAVLMCGWGIPQSGAVAAVGIAVIDGSTKSDLIAALHDSVYTPKEFDGAELAFTQGVSFEHQYTDELVFDGDVLIATVNTIAGDFTNRAHRRVVELNPELGVG